MFVDHIRQYLELPAHQNIVLSQGVDPTTRYSVSGDRISHAF